MFVNVVMVVVMMVEVLVTLVLVVILVLVSQKILFSVFLIINQGARQPTLLNNYMRGCLSLFFQGNYGKLFFNTPYKYFHSGWWWRFIKPHPPQGWSVAHTPPPWGQDVAHTWQCLGATPSSMFEGLWTMQCCEWNQGLHAYCLLSPPSISLVQPVIFF